MNDPENNFEPLRKLLALKKHEVPPPGYFNGFSNQVISRIRLGEAAKAEGVMGRLVDEAPWLIRFIRIFEAKPAYAGMFASVMFLFLVAGIVYSDHPEVTTDALAPASAPAPNNSALAVVSPGFMEQSVSQPSGLVSSTNPVLSLEPGSSPFGGQSPLFQPVGFTR